MDDFKLKPEIEKILLRINFIERYDELVNNYKLKDTSMEKVDKDKILEIISELGYKAKYNKSEKFFKIKHQKIGNYSFEFNLAFPYGKVEFIWVVMEKDKVLLGSPCSSYKNRILDGNYKYPCPFCDNYEEVKNVLEIGFKMYEDFKKEFLRDKKIEIDL